MITLVVGTRPELIKMAPVMRALDAAQVPYTYIHTKQHYDAEMDSQIARDLDLREPDYALDVGSGTHAIQTATIMTKLEVIFDEIKPSIIVVQGDTNTVLAAALTAVKMQIPVAHVEAGLRSFDRQMPEEINRIVTDHISTLLFAPTAGAAKHLSDEGITGDGVIITGNTVVDTLFAFRSALGKSSILESINVVEKKYVLLTAHRQENVDNKETLQKLLAVVEQSAQALKMPVVWPIHPRAKKRLGEYGLVVGNNWKLLPPVGYIDMLALEKNAGLIMTDSGGIQEEAYILHVPAVTLRSTTERPETLSANFLVDTDMAKVENALAAFQQNTVNWGNELGDGNAGEKIAQTLMQWINRA